MEKSQGLNTRQDVQSQWYWGVALVFPLQIAIGWFLGLFTDLLRLIGFLWVIVLSAVLSSHDRLVYRLAIDGLVDNVFTVWVFDLNLHLVIWVRSVLALNHQWWVVIKWVVLRRGISDRVAPWVLIIFLSCLCGDWCPLMILGKHIENARLRYWIWFIAKVSKLRKI